MFKFVANFWSSVDQLLLKMRPRGSKTAQIVKNRGSKGPKSSQKEKVVFASRITYYLRRLKNVSIFENGPQKAWLDPKKRQKTSKNSVFRPLGPLRGPEKQRFWAPRRGPSPVFGRFLSKNRAGTPPKTSKTAFLSVFWAFLSVFWSILSVFEASGPGPAGPGRASRGGPRGGPRACF